MPFAKGRSGNPTGRKKGTPNAFSAEMRGLARNLLTREYWLSLRRRLTAGELPPGLEAKLWEYAYGAPESTHAGSGVTVNIGFLGAPQDVLPTVTIQSIPAHANGLGDDSESTAESGAESALQPHGVLLDSPP